jgi:hypothetical protein
LDPGYPYTIFGGCPKCLGWFQNSLLPVPNSLFSAFANPDWLYAFVHMGESFLRAEEVLF